MTVRTSDGTWVVPTYRAVWIPATVPHTITMSGTVAMRTLYLKPRLARALPRDCCVVNISPLLKELILHACAFASLKKTIPWQRHLIDVIIDQLESVQVVPLQLPNPSDRRALRIAEALLTDPSEVAATPTALQSGRGWQEDCGETLPGRRRHHLWKVEAEPVYAGNAAPSGGRDCHPRRSRSRLQYAKRIYFHVQGDLGDHAGVVLQSRCKWQITPCILRCFNHEWEIRGFGEPLHVKQGEQVLMHILNSSPAEVLWIAVAGHSFHIIALDGNPVPQPQTVRMPSLAPAERVCAIVEMKAPGIWVLGEVRKHVQAASMGLVIEYAGVTVKPVWTQPADLTWDNRQFAAPGETSHSGDESVRIELAFDSKFQGHGNEEFWKMNGKHRVVILAQVLHHQPVALTGLEDGLVGLRVRLMAAQILRRQSVVEFVPLLFQNW